MTDSFLLSAVSGTQLSSSDFI